MIYTAAFANRCLQNLGNLITSKQFIGHFCVANLYSVFSHTKVISLGVCAVFTRVVVASSFFYSAKIRSFINCDVLLYIIAIVIVTSCSEKSNRFFVILQLYILLCQQFWIVFLFANAVLHIKHVKSEVFIYYKVLGLVNLYIFLYFYLFWYNLTIILVIISLFSQFTSICRSLNGLASRVWILSNKRWLKLTNNIATA